MNVRKIIMPILAGIFSIFAFLFFYVTCGNLIFAMLDKAYHSNIDKTDDKNVYFSKEYIDYNGGKQAENFFDRYAYDENYIDAEFHYKDGRKMISTHNYCTVFVLDIYYENLPKDILDCCHLIFNEYNTICYKEPFIIYKINSEQGIYAQNSAFVMLDQQHNTVRYVFVYSNSIASDEIVESLNHVLPELNWNVDVKDWIFDYSNIDLK